MKPKTIKSTKDFTFFLDFPKIAQQINIPQIALGGGEPTLFPQFIKQFASKCKKYGIIVNLTTNGYNISPEILPFLQDFTMISFSFDAFKVQNVNDAQILFEKMDLMREAGKIVGVNILLDEKTISNLDLIIGEIQQHADRLYFLQKKPSTINDGQELKIRLLKHKLFFPEIYVDDCLQMFFGHKESCERGKGIISINPTGEVSYCSFDRPFAQLSQARDLISILNLHYPQEKTTSCPYQ